jgi:hypothetical protein
LGNGLIDPDGQGVDGLDFLHNLAFTNFNPGIACVLGDELADAQARSFQRQHLQLNTGQGVFFLDTELSTVPGVALQQFNRSPQIQSIPDESNADFMEAAIPMEALGEVQPGDRIKIGGVVGGPRFFPEQQIRHLDSAFLGRHLYGSSTNQVLLEGVPVQLAADPEDADGDGLINRREKELKTDPQLADTDGDGLGDAWEVAHGLDPSSAAGEDGADGDPDGDGFANRLEQKAGTDPLRAASVLRLQLVHGENGRHRFIWPAVIGKKYQLEFAAEPMGDFQVWENAAFPLEADNEVESFEVDPSEISVPSRELYYRLQVIP